MARKKKHEHHDCEHDMKFCAPCNEAYCGKCDATWTAEPCQQAHYPWFVQPYQYGTYTQPWDGGTITTTTGGTGNDIYAYTTSHSAC